MNALTFADPWAFLLVPLPLLMMRILQPVMATAGAVVVPDTVATRLGAHGSIHVEGARRRAVPALLWLCLVLALAGPRVTTPVSALPVSGRDLVLALDFSGSMEREDFAIDGRTTSRLDAVKTVATTFVRGRAGDRVALIIFGSEAFYATPFTFDVEAVARTIDEAVIGVSGRATNISDALGLSLKRLDASDAAAKVVILLSDGSNNASAVAPRDAARLAAEMDVRVHTIALGPKDETTAYDGERGVVDAATLGAIARASGGETFRVRTTEDLAAVARQIDTLEATAADGLAAEVYRDLWIWPACLAFALSLFAAGRRAVP